MADREPLCLVDGAYQEIPDGDNLVLGSNTGFVKAKLQDYGGQWFNVKAYGAVGDGSTDDAAAIQAAIDEGGTTFFPPGTYRVESTLTVYSNTTLLGVRGSSILDYSQRGSYSTFADPFISGAGTVGSDVNLTANITAGDATFTVADTTGYSSGQMLLLYSNETWPEGPSGSNPHGELAHILTVNSSTEIALVGNALDSYLTANTARIAVVSPITNVVIRGLTVLGRGEADAGDGDCGIQFIYGKDITVSECGFSRVDQVSVELVSVYGAVIENCSFYHGPSPFFDPVQYGVKISNASMFVTVSQNEFINSRHAVNTGHSTSYPGVQRFIAIEDNSVTGTWHAGLSTHNICEYIAFRRNRISGCAYGINIRCSHVECTDNEIVNCGHGIFLTSRPETLLIRGNRIIDSTSNAIYLDSVETGWEPSFLTITDNYIENCERGVLIVGQQGTATKRGLLISGNTIRNATAASGIRVAGTFSGVVSNNVIDTALVDGIRLVGVLNTFATGNKINGAAVGIDLRDDSVTSAVATGNAIEWNFISSATTLVSNTATGTNTLQSNGLLNNWDASPLYIHNKADQVTNYERLEMGWGMVNADRFEIRTNKGGSGTARTVAFLYGTTSTNAIQIGTSANGGLELGRFSTASALTSGRAVVGSSSLNNTAASGESISLNLIEKYGPTATSTMIAVPLKIRPTIDYSNGTPGAGSYEALKIAVTETALPTGQSYLIRASAGAAGTTDVFTVTNAGKVGLAGIVVPNIQTVASAATVTPNADTDHQVNITAQAEALILANPSGTPVAGQKLIVRIKDDATARAITYGTQYRAMGTALPTTTVVSKMLYLGFIWNATDTKLDLVAMAQEA